MKFNTTDILSYLIMYCYVYMCFTHKKSKILSPPTPCPPPTKNQFSAPWEWDCLHCKTLEEFMRRDFFFKDCGGRPYRIPLQNTLLIVISLFFKVEKKYASLNIFFIFYFQKLISHQGLGEHVKNKERSLGTRIKRHVSLILWCVCLSKDIMTCHLQHECTDNGAKPPKTSPTSID